MRYLSVILLLLLITACEDESAGRKAPVPVGYSAYIQAHLNETDDKALIGASFYRDGRQIMLVAGDMVMVTNGGNAAAPKGNRNNMGFYSAWLDIDNAADGVDFSIDYLPIIAREDRWYPADIAYVDNGPGRYVGELYGDLQFPPRVTIVAPGPGDNYTSKTEPLTISWSNDPDAEQVRVEAFLGCVGKTVHVGTKKNSSAAVSDSLTVTIEDLFDKLPLTVTAPLEGLVLEILHIMTLGLVPEHKPKVIKECDIDLYVLAEKHQEIGGIFEAGSTVVASRSNSVRIRVSFLDAPLIIP